MTITLNGTTGITSTVITETSDGNVGIGTSLPGERLDVYLNTTGNVSAKVGNTSGSVQLLQSNGLAYLYTAANQPIAFSTSNTERMRIDSAGRVTMPYQPAFQVRLSATQGLSANVRTKVDFDTIDYENGSNYSTANKRFTAPVTGFYQFNVIVYAYTVNNHEVTLWKNGGVYIRSQFEASNIVNPVNGVLVAATKLTAGDYVEIYSSVDLSGAIYHSAERPTTWSGFLIC